MNTTSLPTNTKRRPINTHQLQLLTTLYKFRYCTAQIIASSQGAKHTRVILTRLKILVDQGYIGQNYDSSYKIIGKPATYHLLPKGIQILRQQPFADPKVLKQIYYDKNKDDGHIQHRLNVFKSYVFIKQNYPKQFQFFSKSELPSLKYKLPRDLTDVYLQKNEEINVNDGANKPYLTAPDYFLSFYEASAPYWRIRNSIRRYITYAESEKWQKATERGFPIVLIACETRALERRLQNLTKRELDNNWVIVKFEFLPVNH
ncbi:MAG: hypothetical protein NTX11_03990 [Candidatus Saccharibacteria bacterium]|nr:hypothetical protein [Candidatus Saccharibacteria bacterium]